MLRSSIGRALLLVLSVLFIAVDVHALTFDRIHVVYRSPTNGWLFRGDQPRNASISNVTECGSTIPYSSCFDYDTLLSFLHKKAVEEASSDFPDSSASFSFYDLSFISNFSPTEKIDFNAEISFFLKHPQLGFMYPWGLHGVSSAQCPWEYTEDVRLQLASTFPRWDKDALVPNTAFLHTMLTENKKPVVAYGHCEEGIDRTGEMMAAYQMRFLNLSFPESMKIADAVGGRPIHIENRCAAQWFCYYLQTAGYDGLDCLNNSTLASSSR
eukprot:ANDGO_03935.mRNA.1 hypothetical protein DDB_G0285459